jgi:hypothetical protein
LALPTFAQAGTPTSSVVQSAIQQVSLSTSTTSLSFPGDIQNAQYYTRLSFAQYNRARPNSTREDKITATIILPLPEAFGDSQQAMWNDGALGLAGADLKEFKDLVSKGYEAGADLASNIRKNGSGGINVNELIQSLGTTVMAFTPSSMRDGQLQARAMQELGAVTNPHLSLTYNGQGLRNHVLNWKFAPRTEQEATTLGNIIQTMRLRTLPSYNKTVNKFALDYPDTVSVTFQGVDANFKTKIFKSAVKEITTDLSPSGLTFYPNGRPVIVNLSMALTETEIVTREDFDGTNK